MSARLVVEACTGALSFQDGGRRGYQRQGLSGSGPMDRLALAAANALVGNALGIVALELGLGGGRFRLEGGDLWMALAGAPCALRVDGVPVSDHRAFPLSEGSTLAIAAPEPAATCDAATFDPVVELPEGVAGPAEDPMFAIRSPTYAISLTRRSQ